MKNFSTHLKESILDPVKQELCPQVFDKDKIKDKVKKQILDNLYSWAEKLRIKDEIQAVKVVGSLMTYQYSDDSDLDINVELGIDKNKMERIKKLLPNGELLSGTKHPINYFISSESGTKGTQRGIYDLLEDKWEKKVESSEQDIFYFYKTCLDQMISWARKISLDVDEIDRDAMELTIYRKLLEDKDYRGSKDDIKRCIQAKEMELKADYDILKVDHSVLKLFRNEAFGPEYKSFNSRTYDAKEEHPDFSYNNVVYKLLEKFGYFKLIDDTKDKYKKEFPEILKED